MTLVSARLFRFWLLTIASLLLELLGLLLQFLLLIFRRLLAWLALLLLSFVAVFSGRVRLVLLSILIALLLTLRICRIFIRLILTDLVLLIFPFTTRFALITLLASLILLRRVT